MITKHQNNSWLLLFFKIFHQFFKCLIALLNQRQIFFCRSYLGSLIQFIGQIYRFPEIVGILAVSAMILHGHFKCKQLLVCTFFLIQIDNFLKCGFITDIVPDLLWCCKCILKNQIVKSEQWVHCIPVPSASIIWMDRCSSVSEFSQPGGQAWNLALYILLIWHTSRRHKCHRISGKKFKLGICCIPAFYGYIRMPLQHIFIQRMDERHIIFTNMKITKYGQIRKCFIHNHNHIRQVLLCSCRLLCLVTLCYLFCGFCRITFRFFYFHKTDISCKTSQEAIIPIQYIWRK